MRAFQVVSHAPLALAAWAAWRSGGRVAAAVYVAAVLASLLYHAGGERPGPAASLDHALAFAVFVANAYGLMRPGVRPGCTRLALGLALASVIMYASCGAPRSARYERCHPWWHVVAGVGTCAVWWR